MPDKLLLIDDSRDVHKLIAVRLAREPIEIHYAHCAAEGIQMALQVQPDLILLDVDMPERDGFWTCQQLKGDLATMHIPLVFLTGAASSEETIRGLELGAVDYIIKPFDAAELRRVRACLRTKNLMDLLSKKAMIDGLTGLWNRMYFDARLTMEHAASRRSSRALSCIMADVDRFKVINDTFGHSTGDDILRAVADILSTLCRTEDVVCRYGGEEFAILLPNTSLEDAAIVAERLRAGIERLSLAYHQQQIGVTCSFGVADLRATVPPTVVELADDALYQAKNAGRNRVERAAA